MATVNEKMTAIADAIREKTGGTDKLTLDDMAADIPKVYETGKKSQYAEFWDNFQDCGNTPISYNYAFAEDGTAAHKRWNVNNYKPKYNIVPTSAYYMFFQTALEDIYYNNIDVDFSLATSVQSCFYNAKQLKRLKVVSTISASSLQQFFDRCRSLNTIEKLILKADGSQTFLNTFLFCDVLANIVIEGKIGQNIDFSNSPLLTHDSLMSIINALLETSETKTLTIGTKNLAKLNDSDKAIATQKGWTLA